MSAERAQVQRGGEGDRSRGRAPETRFEARCRAEFALEIAIIRAQTQAGLGDTPGALRSLRAVIAQTRSQEFRGFELQARLAAAEIKLKSSQKSAARQELGALADEARVQGFGLIARQATEVAK